MKQVAHTSDTTESEGESNGLRICMFRSGHGHGHVSLIADHNRTDSIVLQRFCEHANSHIDSSSSTESEQESYGWSHGENGLFCSWIPWPLGHL